MAAVLVRRKLFRYMMDEGSNIEEQVWILRGYQEQLVALDSTVSDETLHSFCSPLYQTPGTLSSALLTPAT